MNILAIDPGNEKSAWLNLMENHQNPQYPIFIFDIMENESLIDNIKLIYTIENLICVIEMVASYGMPVGKTIFETCLWIGKFVRQCEICGIKTELVYRRDIKLHFCNSARAKDSNIRQVLLDRYGKEATKGIKKDIWQALAIATYWRDKHFKDAKEL